MEKIMKIYEKQGFFVLGKQEEEEEENIKFSMEDNGWILAWDLCGSTVDESSFP